MSQIIYVPRVGGTLILRIGPPVPTINVTWLTRDNKASWLTRDGKTTFTARDGQVTWKTRS